MDFKLDCFEALKEKVRAGDNSYLHDLTPIAYIRGLDSYERGYGKLPTKKEMSALDILARKNPLSLLDTIEQADLNPERLEDLLKGINLRSPKDPTLLDGTYNDRDREIVNQFYGRVSSKILAQQTQKGGYESNPEVKIVLHPNIESDGLTGSVEGRWIGHSIDCLIAEYSIDPKGKITFSKPVFEEHKQ